MKLKRIQIRDMAFISLMAAVLCIVGPLTIPVGIVPVTTIIFFIYLLVYILGTQNAFISCIVYIAIGLFGMPVYSGYTAGPAIVFGPTGGYMIGYLWIILFSGIFIERWPKRVMHLPGMLLGLLFCYMAGTIWLMHQMDLTFRQAIVTGVVPFVLFDILKLITALFIGPVFRRRLKKADLLSEK